MFLVNFGNREDKKEGEDDIFESDRYVVGVGILFLFICESDCVKKKKIKEETPFYSYLFTTFCYTFTYYFWKKTSLPMTVKEKSDVPMPIEKS